MTSSPRLLANWIRHSAPLSTTFDHEHLGQYLDNLQRVLDDLPGILKSRQVAQPVVAHAEPSTPETRPDRPIPISTLSIQELGPEFVKRQIENHSWDPNTADQAGATFNLFARLMREERGITRFVDLRQADLEHFNAHLLSIHKYYGKSSRERNCSIAELRAVAATKTDAERGLSIGTRTRHFGFLSGLFEMAKETEDLDPRLRPAAFTGKKKVRARDQRSIPKPDAMAKFFESPVFVGCRSEDEFDEPGPLVFHRAAYFGPMLAHYQGMRREEFCGPAVNDIVLDNGEHPYIHVRFNEFRRLQNNQSVRNLALHPELVRLGFLAYLDCLRNLGISRVFPDLHNPLTRAALGDRLYKELQPIRERLGITPHQFRHFFNNELKQNRVPRNFGKI
ncbi:hypothetical protein [Devosia marina]|uniref:Core-binding (CB) domain-containing protein n=1 Tax=Devosia marina TaxID=2683198 RepID=A0A7X3FVA2_9HYPH|nr:hypothetical protein [Devosia marina]MVT00591.1 hypothetical protein [Devosia marina]